MPVSINKRWSILFALWIMQGGIALWQLLALPSDGGLSLQRYLLGGIPLAWIVFSALLTISALRKSKRFENLLNFIRKPNVKDALFAAALFTITMRIWFAFLRMLFEAGGNFKYSGYTERLDPLLNLLALVSLEIIALVLFFVFRNWNKQKASVQIFIKRASIVLTVLGLISAFVYSSGWGIAPAYKGDWSRGIPAVALMEWHIIIACAFSAAMMILEAKQKLAQMKNPDAWICLAVWLVTASLWLSQPVAPSSSAFKPREPNFEIYPFNDAQVYDGFAQSVLVGNGYGEREIPQRPLYVVMLTAMHVIAGQNYDSVIFLQTLWFAFFPVLLYLFGREFFGRPIGISIALLAILRDYTSNIAAPFTGNLTYSKLYLAEIPTAMLLILFLLIGMRWIKTGFPLFLGFLMGGILGIAMLIRTQAVVAFPVLILFALLTRPRLFLPALKSAALGVVSLALVISPWLVRNRVLTGQMIFDNPASQTINLALRYSWLNGIQEVPVLPLTGESNTDYNDRMLSIAQEQISSNPLGAAKGIASFFINHGINNILLFPLRYDLDSFGELGTPTKAFWQWWHGELNLLQSLLLGFYIFLFGLGLTVSWQKLGWLGFLPLGANLAYNLWTSIALLSGQRFMLTMDWSAYMYYMIGVFALLSVFMFIIERGRGLIREWYAQNQFTFVEFADNTTLRGYIFSGILFFVIGASLWGVEMIFPQRYPPISQDKLADKIMSSSSFKLDAACFQKAIAANELHLVQGRALYPRYYWADDGETFTDAYGYKKSDENRIVFEMVGQMNGRVVFPIAEPAYFFPNASDVTLGFDKQGGAWFVLVEQGNEVQFYLADIFTGCP